MPAVFCLMVGFLFVLVVASWPKKVRRELKVEVIKPESVSTSDRIFSGFARDIASIQRDAGILELDYRQIERDIHAAANGAFYMLGRLPPANLHTPEPLLPASKVRKKKKPPVAKEVDASIPPRSLDRRKPNPTTGCSIEEGGPDVHS